MNATERHIIYQQVTFPHDDNFRKTATARWKMADNRRESWHINSWFDVIYSWHILREYFTKVTWFFDDILGIELTLKNKHWKNGGGANFFVLNQLQVNFNYLWLILLYFFIVFFNSDALFTFVIEQCSRLFDFYYWTSTWTRKHLTPTSRTVVIIWGLFPRALLLYARLKLISELLNNEWAILLNEEE